MLNTGVFNFLGLQKSFLKEDRLTLGLQITQPFGPYKRTKTGNVVPVANIYLHNMIDMWWTIPVFLGGVLAVLYGVLRTAFSNSWNKGVWWASA